MGKTPALKSVELPPHALAHPAHTPHPAPTDKSSSLSQTRLEVSRCATLRGSSRVVPSLVLDHASEISTAGASPSPRPPNLIEISHPTNTIPAAL